MTDHAEKAESHLEAAVQGDDTPLWVHVAAAGIHAVLHVAETIRHGLRDVVYELRD